MKEYDLIEAEYRDLFKNMGVELVFKEPDRLIYGKWAYNIHGVWWRGGGNFKAATQEEQYEKLATIAKHIGKKRKIRTGRSPITLTIVLPKTQDKLDYLHSLNEQSGMDRAVYVDKPLFDGKYGAKVSFHISYRDYLWGDRTEAFKKIIEPFMALVNFQYESDTHRMSKQIINTYENAKTGNMVWPPYNFTMYLKDHSDIYMFLPVIGKNITIKDIKISKAQQ